MRDHRDGQDNTPKPFDVDVIRRAAAQLSEVSQARMNRLRAIDELYRPHKPRSTRVPVGKGRRGGKAGKILRRQR